MKLFHITLLVALAISGVAAYFSVVGLVALFAAAVIPVAIMGSILEVGKITTVAWLHANWHVAPKVLRTYLISAVAVLMAITSLGIYGFLSKGHLEQTLPIVGIERQMAQNLISIELNNTQIESTRRQIETANSRNMETLAAANTATTNANDKDIRRLEATKSPLDIQINAQRDIISRFENRLQSLDDTISSYNAANAITRGRAALAEQKPERDEILNGISLAESAILQLEIEKSNIDQEIFALGDNAVSSTQPELINVDRFNDSIASLIKSNADLAGQNTELQLRIDTTTAKLGPVKYVAELFGIEDSGVAVRWVIVLIMFAFDPVAIALLIAAQWSAIHGKDSSASDQDLQRTNDALTDVTNKFDMLKVDFEEMSSNHTETTNNIKIAYDAKITKLTETFASAETEYKDQISALTENQILNEAEDANITFIVDQLKKDDRLAVGFKKIIEQAEVDKKTAWIKPQERK